MKPPRYAFTVPASPIGSHAGTCSAAYNRGGYKADALRQYNSARAHDNLPPVRRMPRGTIYARIAP